MNNTEKKAFEILYFLLEGKKVTRHELTTRALDVATFLRLKGRERVITVMKMKEAYKENVGFIQEDK